MVRYGPIVACVCCLALLAIPVAVTSYWTGFRAGTDRGTEVGFKRGLTQAKAEEAAHQLKVPIVPTDAQVRRVLEEMDRDRARQFQNMVDETNKLRKERDRYSALINSLMNTGSRELLSFPQEEPAEPVEHGGHGDHHGLPGPKYRPPLEPVQEANRSRVMEILSRHSK